ncbi:Hypothetical predicted protein [Cloeon dipterum]|uniref:Uncharacterized protein n=1 Tax=Cloeon dipterum TaxID=197152 RepID=A0A8S1DBV1_9INSE|nr:Hypothetical predicted protein [Cloeon dipterum]
MSDNKSNIFTLLQMSKETFLSFMVKLSRMPTLPRKQTQTFKTLLMDTNANFVAKSFVICIICVGT